MQTTVLAGTWNNLEVIKEVDFGVYLDGKNLGEVLLPKRYVPEGLKPGDTINVFIYHDSDSRPIATTDVPKGVVGDIVGLRCVAINAQGAFLDWGLMKDLFVPKSQMIFPMTEGNQYIVAIYVDEQTGRAAATERFAQLLTNDPLTIKVNDAVKLIIQKQTDLGYNVIINSRHTGLLHFSDVFRELETGDTLDGFVKNIRPDGKIDVAAGSRGYARVSPEGEKIMEMLRDNNGYLPYNDKSDPDMIYAFFGMSKKTFKMALGGLYKESRIAFAKEGIQLIEA